MSDKQTEQLKKLLTRVLDSAEGYERAAESAETGRFKPAFESRARTRRQYADELRAELNRHGEKADTDSSLLASAHRVFLDLRAKLIDGDEAVLKEVDRGETTLIENYQEAVSAVHDPATKAVLERQLAAVRRDLVDIKGKEATVS